MAAASPAGRPLLALVTGAGSGIGLELCRQLLAAGHDVVAACRSERSAAETLRRLRRELPSGAAGRADGGSAGRGAAGDGAPGDNAGSDPGRERLSHLVCDLSSLDSVRAAGAAIAARLGGRPLDVLCCNAGAIPLRAQVTRDGLELQAQTNHLGHFLLVHLLLPSLLRSPSARVAIVSSELHRRVPAADAAPDVIAENWRGEYWEGGRRPYESRRVYAETKLCNIWHAAHLATLLPPSVSVCSVSPGWVPATGLSRHKATGLLGLLYRYLAPCIFPGAISVREGASRVAEACLGTGGAAGRPSGLYYSKHVATPPSEAASDAAKAARAFELSAAAVGISGTYMPAP